MRAVIRKCLLSHWPGTELSPLTVLAGWKDAKSGVLVKWGG